MLRCIMTSGGAPCGYAMSYPSSSPTVWIFSCNASSSLACRTSDAYRRQVCSLNPKLKNDPTSAPGLRHGATSTLSRSTSKIPPCPSCKNSLYSSGGMNREPPSPPGIIRWPFSLNRALGGCRLYVFHSPSSSCSGGGSRTGGPMYLGTPGAPGGGAGGGGPRPARSDASEDPNGTPAPPVVLGRPGGGAGGGGPPRAAAGLDGMPGGGAGGGGAAPRTNVLDL